MEMLSQANALRGGQTLHSLHSTSRSSKAAPESTEAVQTSHPAQESETISLRQVRQHLEQLGYYNIPSDVLEEFRQELASRMADTPPTVRKHGEEGRKGKDSSAAGRTSSFNMASKPRQPVFEDENSPRPADMNSESPNRWNSKPHSPTTSDTYHPRALTVLQNNQLDAKQGVQQPKSLKDLCEMKYDRTVKEAGAMPTQTGADARKDRGRSAVLRGTRLGGKPQRVLGGGYEGDESEFEVERSDTESLSVQDVRPQTAPQQEEMEGLEGWQGRRDSMQRASSVKGTPRSERSRASVASSSIIRLQSAQQGQRKADPVAGYWRAKESWSTAPAASGARRQVVTSPPSLKAPQDPQIWKAVHPLDNSLGYSTYQGPSTKDRGAERKKVHDALRRSHQVARSEQPRKTDRVQANEVVRQYTIPDEKRRDGVRWNTRVMMSRCT